MTDTLARTNIVTDLNRIIFALNGHLGKCDRAEVEEIVNGVDVGISAKTMALGVVSDAYSHGPLFSNLFTHSIIPSLDILARRVERGDFG